MTDNTGTKNNGVDDGSASEAEMGQTSEETVIDLSDAAAEEPVDPIVALEAENLELKDKFLRAVAEAENVRKRSERQVAEARIYAVEKFAHDLLSVADNLARALTALTDEARTDLSDAGKSLLQGVEMTEKELIAALQRHGVKPVPAEPGTVFDPNVHQAVGQIPSAHPEGTIAEPFQTGWQIGERTLRAAMVAVSTGSES